MSKRAARKQKQVADARVTLERKIARTMGGSKLDAFNAVVGTQALRSLWTAHSDEEGFSQQQMATIAAMSGVAPKNEVQGMFAAQMVATHNAAMECFRRAMLPDQSFEGRQMALNCGNKLVRSYAMLVEALDRHRGKGQPQVVRVERVTVEAGGQAIVGAVTRGGGGAAKSEDQPHAKQVTHAPEPEMRGMDPEREPVPVAGGEG